LKDFVTEAIVADETSRRADGYFPVKFLKIPDALNKKILNTIRAATVRRL
jgi:hypothetical protein